MAFSGSDNLVHSLEQLAESQPSSLHEIPVFFLADRMVTAGAKS